MERTFAERYGHRQIRTVIQRDDMDNALRNALWDAIGETLFQKVTDWQFKERDEREPVYVLMKRVWNGFFKKPIDDIPTLWPNTLKRLREYFMTCPWYDAYSLLEFIARNAGPRKNTLINRANKYMEREMSGYRFVGDEIAPIIDKVEIESIEEALRGAPPPVATHLDTALTHLSDRVNPDYRNAVKEAILAVEAAVRGITGDSKATLGDALKKLPQPLHPAFQGALSKLYGYTSDEGGIRHALSGEATIDFAEAKFMIVACSAFINFLRERTQEPLA